MFFNKQTLVEKDKKSSEYTFKINDENLSEFYEELFRYLFENGKLKKLDNFLQISQHRIEEYMGLHYFGYDETDD